MVAGKEVFIIDTGPVVSFLNKNDPYHEWTKMQLAQIKAPLLSCESVLSEACFLIGRTGSDASVVLEFLSRGMISIGLSFNKEYESIKRLLKKYADIPMSLADGCMVRLSEIHWASKIITFDSDFKVYRRNGRNVIPTIMPA